MKNSPLRGELFLEAFSYEQLNTKERFCQRGGENDEGTSPLRQFFTPRMGRNRKRGMVIFTDNYEVRHYVPHPGSRMDTRG